MNDQTAGKTALVTGAARRVGKAVAQQLHARGLNLAIHYRGSRADADALAAQLNQVRSNSAITIQADLGDLEALKGMVGQTLDQFGDLSVLVNNASSFHPTPVGTATEADWQGLFDSNARGPFFLSQFAADALRSAQGSIINIVDIHAEKPMRSHTVYCMAKAALMMMTRSLAMELAPEVRVNGVSPGAILWPEPDPSDDEKKRTLARVPLGRIGNPLDIAGAVTHFALDAPYVTGQILAIDGGRTLNM